MTNELTTTNNNILHIEPQRIESLFQRVKGHVDTARQHIYHSIDVNMIKAYWLIGQDIVEEEQYGKARSEYGKALLKGLSIKLQSKYKRGFSVDTLEKARSFYLVFHIDSEISATASRKSGTLSLVSNLSWSHYVELLKATRSEAIRFYALEASKNNWNVRELRRQMSSFLYDRLLKSKNKKAMLEMSLKGQEINTPRDAIKEPLVLEFIDAPEPRKLSETDLETAIINNLQDFLMELGRGFAFMGRQKRITFDNDHYYADLVFYHVVLKCYVIVDLKTHKLSHADLGQMQLYVNYYDREIKMSNDNPTIGLVLCTQKSNSMVNYMLGEKTTQIFASTYQFHLPSEKELEEELQRELSLFTSEKNATGTSVNMEPS